jgi:hypothetical protein
LSARFAAPGVSPMQRKLAKLLVIASLILGHGWAAPVALGQ